MNFSVAVAIGDPALREEVLKALAAVSAGIADEDCWAADAADIVAAVKRSQPDVLVLGLEGLSEDIGETLKRIVSLQAAPRVIAVSRRAEPDAILKAMRSGASEFVYPPFEGAFAEACQRIAESCRRREPELQSLGRVLGFVAAKGGCGATTLACHAAAHLREGSKKSILLADLDSYSGLVGLLMQVAAHHTVADALQNLHRLDVTLWKAMVLQAACGVDVIPAPAAPFDFGASLRKLPQLLRFWRAQYDLTILDFGHGFTPLLAEVAEWVDTVAVVCTNEVPALRQAKLLLQGLGQRNCGTNRVRLIINRMPKRTEIQLPELERIMNYPIQATLPNDYKSLADAYTEPHLLSASHPLGTHMAQVAAQLAGMTLPEPKKGFRLSLFH